MNTLVDAEARRQIRCELDTNMVVEAAAGTGKTTELVERVVAVLGEGRGTVESLVAVTFTEKAAGELKLRLRARLESARQGTDGAVASNLEQALARLEEARVSTIHGFCADLLRERPVEARVDPQFRVMTEVESRQLFSETFRRWLQTTLENPPEGIRRALRRSSYAGSPSARLEQAAWTLADWRDFTADWRRDPFEREAEIDALVVQLAAFVDLRARCTAPNRDNLYRDTRAAWRVREDILGAEAVRVREYDGIEAAIAGLATGREYRDFREPRHGTGTWFGKGLERDEVLQAHASLCASLQAFTARADADLAPLLQRELRAVIAAYEEVKLRSGRLDFLDLLLRARDLICSCDPVRADFQRRFSHIFVDEFQDTDPLQAEILLLLAADDPSQRDWRAVTPAPGKLFLVGDPKQSIYRFRRADVGIYLEVKQMLAGRGAACLELSTSFRSVPAIQQVVNAGFAGAMKADATALQPGYVPLAASRAEVASQPSVIVLPVPRPLGRRGGVTATAIEASLPDAVGAFVDWLLTQSGWTVAERSPQSGREERVPISARHVCLLFRRFDNMFSGDMTRGYVQSLESRGIPHLLVGGSGFHEREEVGTMRAALAAIEWPDDELSVFATLRGSLFSFSDEELFEYRHLVERLHPFRVPPELPPHLEKIGAALAVIRDLHRGRNRCTVAETIALLLETTRAAAGLVLRPSGEQVLANVLHLSELARAYESRGGVSFRGFVQQLLAEADAGKAAEAPILEEGSDGVRLMTVHKAKGLEFPVVILADVTARLARPPASRWIDAARRLCAVRLAGWSPTELLEHDADELAREQAEGVRVAYVAATRARDLLVVPAVGADPFENGWTAPLNGAIYPPRTDGRFAEPASVEVAGCPPFGASSMVVAPPPGEAGGYLVEDDRSVRPGRHDFAEHGVVWFDPAILRLDAQPFFGIRQEELIGRDAPPAVVATDLARYEEWRGDRAAALARGGRPTLVVHTATARAAGGEGVPAEVEVAEVGRAAGRPAGPRFGALVHAILAAIDLGAARAAIDESARMFGRLLAAENAEVDAAVTAVEAALRHPLLQRARAAQSRGECRRETPMILADADTVVDGIVDLAFAEAGRWTVIDFKTDRELAECAEAYKRQVSLYARTISAATGQPATPVLLRV